MKPTFACSCLLAAAFSYLVEAIILLDSIPDTVNVNDDLEVKWSANQTYNLELHFVQQGQGQVAWTSIETIFQNHTEPAGNSSYNLTVPVVASSGTYGLWLSGMNVPDNGRGYANLTNWFKVDGGPATAPSTPDGHGKFKAKVAASVIGSALAIALIVAAGVLIWRRRVLRRALATAGQMRESPRDSFDSVMEEKARMKVAMQETQA